MQNLGAQHEYTRLICKTPLRAYIAGMRVMSEDPVGWKASKIDREGTKNICLPS